MSLSYRKALRKRWVLVGDGEDAVEDLTVTWETEALGDLGFEPRACPN